MKIRFGDLILPNGMTIRKLEEECQRNADRTMSTGCTSCMYQGNEYCTSNIMGKSNIEVEILPKTLTEEGEETPQKDDDTERNGYKNVYICSPYRGYTLTNTEAARRFCKWAIQEKSVLPFAPHIYFTQFFDDELPEQREIGMNMAVQWLRKCSEIWVLGETLSAGMTCEIAKAARIGMPIRFFLEDEDGFIER